MKLRKNGKDYKKQIADIKNCKVYELHTNFKGVDCDEPMDFDFKIGTLSKNSHNVVLHVHSNCWYEWDVK